MTRLLRSLFLAVALAGVPRIAPAIAQTSPAGTSPTQTSPTGTSPTQAAPAADAETRPADFPANLRWDLVPKWIKWVADKAQICWPPNDGCAAAPVVQSLTAGQMIDRFGSEFGTFFSPKGESFRSRAVPYVCRQMD